MDLNKEVFASLFKIADPQLHVWKRNESSWSLLEIICHLYDEEREDFRRRLQFVLNEEEGDPPRINPSAWVTERHYMDQDFKLKLDSFINERADSIRYLETLDNPNLNKAYQHPRLGPLSGYHFLANWLAHDYLHIRQITKVKYDYLGRNSGQKLDYAGEWK